MEESSPEKKRILRKFYLLIAGCFVASTLIAFGIAELAYGFIFDGFEWQRVLGTAVDSMDELAVKEFGQLERLGTRYDDRELRRQMEFYSLQIETAKEMIERARSRASIVWWLTFLGMLMISFICLYIYYGKISLNGDEEEKNEIIGQGFSVDNKK